MELHAKDLISNVIEVFTNILQNFENFIFLQRLNSCLRFYSVLAVKMSERGNSEPKIGKCKFSQK